MTRLLAALPLGRSVPEQAALDAALAVLPVSPEPGASLLVLTEDAGSSTALDFYAAALAAGPALANPASFPWCLANAPCAAIARRFALTGPNVTWLVDSLDTPDGYAPAAAWLDGGAEAALIVGLRFRGASPRLVAWLWEPGDGRVEARLMRADWCAAACLAAA